MLYFKCSINTDFRHCLHSLPKRAHPTYLWQPHWPIYYALSALPHSSWLSEHWIWPIVCLQGGCSPPQQQKRVDQSGKTLVMSSSPLIGLGEFTWNNSSQWKLRGVCCITHRELFPFISKMRPVKLIFIYPNFRFYTVRIWYMNLLQPYFFLKVKKTKKQPKLRRNMKPKPSSRLLLPYDNRFLLLGKFPFVFLLFALKSILYRCNFIMKVFRKSTTHWWLTELLIIIVFHMRGAI